MRSFEYSVELIGRADLGASVTGEDSPLDSASISSAGPRTLDRSSLCGKGARFNEDREMVEPRRAAEFVGTTGLVAGVVGGALALDGGSCWSMLMGEEGAVACAFDIRRSSSVSSCWSTAIARNWGTYERLQP